MSKWKLVEEELRDYIIVFQKNPDFNYDYRIADIKKRLKRYHSYLKNNESLSDIELIQMIMSLYFDLRDVVYTEPTVRKYKDGRTEPDTMEYRRSAGDIYKMFLAFRDISFGDFRKSLRKAVKKGILSSHNCPDAHKRVFYYSEEDATPAYGDRYAKDEYGEYWEDGPKEYNDGYECLNPIHPDDYFDGTGDYQKKCGHRYFNLYDDGTRFKYGGKSYNKYDFVAMQYKTSFKKGDYGVGDESEIAEFNLDGEFVTSLAQKKANEMGDDVCIRCEIDKLGQYYDVLIHDYVDDELYEYEDVLEELNNKVCTSCGMPKKYCVCEEIKQVLNS